MPAGITEWKRRLAACRLPSTIVANEAAVCVSVRGLGFASADLAFPEARVLLPPIRYLTCAEHAVNHLADVLRNTGKH